MEIYGQIKQDIGVILRKLCQQKGVEIIEAQVCSDHIHMLISIPPKYSVSQIMGYLKGKSSLMIFDRHANLKYKYGNRHFWARGYYVDTVGRNKKAIKEYTTSGGAIFVSGNYLLSDLSSGAEATESDKAFVEQVLHAKFGGNATTRNGKINTKPTKFASKRIKLSFNTLPSEEIYSVEYPEVVTPSGSGAITALQYDISHTSAAVAYKGNYATFVMGFPYETIVDEKERISLLSEILNWLTK